MKKHSLLISAILVATMLLSVLAIPAAAAKSDDKFPLADNAGITWRGIVDGQNPPLGKEAVEAVDFAWFSGLGSSTITVDGALDEAYQNVPVWQLSTYYAANKEGTQSGTVAEIAPARADEAGTGVAYDKWAGKVTATMRGVWDANYVYLYVDVTDSTINKTQADHVGDRIEFLIAPPHGGYSAEFVITPTADGAIVKSPRSNVNTSFINAASKFKDDNSGYIVEFRMDVKAMVNSQSNEKWFQYVEAQNVTDKNTVEKNYYYRDWQLWYETQGAIETGALFDFNLRIVDCLSKDTDTADEINANKNGIDSKIDGILSWSSITQYTSIKWSQGTGRVYLGCGTHTFGTPVVTKEASHTEFGEQSKTCTACKYVATEQIAKLPDHTYTTYAGHDENQHKHVCACGEYELLNHKWGEEVVVDEPTLTATGKALKTCTDCGEQMEIVLEKLPAVTEAPTQEATEAPTQEGTKAPTDGTKAPDTNADDEAGCASVAGGAAVAVLAIVSALSLGLRKKED